MRAGGQFTRAGLAQQGSGATAAERWNCRAGAKRSGAVAEGAAATEPVATELAERRAERSGARISIPERSEADLHSERIELQVRALTPQERPTPD